MITKNVLAILLFLGLFSCVRDKEINMNSSKNKLDSIPIWYLMAKSNCVIQANIDLPTKSINNMFQKNEFGYISLNLVCNKIYKGKIINDKIISKIYIGDFKKDLLESINHKTCLIFITDVSSSIESVDFHIFYFTQTSVYKENLVRTECETQNQIIKDFKKYSKGINFYCESTIAGLVDQIVTPTKEYSVNDTLNKLDSTYCPAIIKYLNDYRPIQINSINFRNEKKFWEESRHYGPNKVIDYLAAILNDLSGANFGSIYNGDQNDLIRNDTYNGWIVWLYNKNRINTICKYRLPITAISPKHLNS